MNADTPMVLLLASDLMLSSTISGHATAAGCEFRTAASVADAAGLQATHANILVLVDLGLPGLDIADLAARTSLQTLQSAVAYGPHVHVQKLQAAREAGFGRVISRGAFSANAHQIITDFSGAARDQNHG